MCEFTLIFYAPIIIWTYSHPFLCYYVCAPLEYRQPGTLVRSWCRGWRCACLVVCQSSLELESLWYVTRGDHAILSLVLCCIYFLWFWCWTNFQTYYCWGILCQLFYNFYCLSNNSNFNYVVHVCFVDVWITSYLKDLCVICNYLSSREIGCYSEYTWNSNSPLTFSEMYLRTYLKCTQRFISKPATPYLSKNGLEMHIQNHPKNITEMHIRISP